MKNALVVALLAFQAAHASAAINYTTEEFPAGTYFVPMDSEAGNQQDVTHAYAFIWRFMKAGGVVYRCIQDGTPASQLQVAFEVVYNPTGARSPAVFSGGPFFILNEPEQAKALEQAHNFLPAVTVNKLSTAFTWSRTLAAASPTRILVIQDKNSWGDSGGLLKEMGLPFTQVGYDEVRANPHAYVNPASYDVILDECGGWCVLSGSKPGSSMGEGLKQAFVDFATAGGMLMFNDRSLRDLEFCFPGYVAISTNFESTRESWYETEFTFVNFNSFVSQSEFPTGRKIKIGTKVQGNICSAVHRPDVTSMLTCANFDFNHAGWPKKEGFASGAFFFEYPQAGRGMVAGFAYHNEEQKDYTRKMVFAFLGNRLIQAVVLRQPTATPSPVPAPTEISAPTDLDISQDGEFVALTWKAPEAAAEICGYHVVHSSSPTGPFKKLTSQPVKELRASIASKQFGGRIFYFAAVSVGCAGGESGYSNVVTNATLVPPTKAPTPRPPGDVLQHIGPSKTVLSWTPPNHAPGIAGYHLYAGPTRGGPYEKLTEATLAGTSQTFVTGQERTYYVVTAVDRLGQESEYSEEAKPVYDATVTPTFTPTALPSPRNVKLKQREGRFFLSWDAGPREATGSHIYSRPEDVDEMSRLNGDAVKGTEFDLARLQSERTYYFRVTFLYPQGESERSAEVGIFLSKIPTPTAVPTKKPTITLSPTATEIFFLPPSAPVGVSARAGDGGATVSWSRHTDKNVVSYNVYQSVSAGTAYQKVKVGVKQPETSFLVARLSPGTRYYFVVTAVNAAKQESAFSKEVSASP